jgi:phage gp36-like protein
VAYASADDMIARYPNRDLVQLTNEDPTQTAINPSIIGQALADASAEIDGYLDGRFALPLNDVPTVLNRLACDVAMYRLQSLRPLHDMADARKRYEDAVELLVRVARGEVTLGLTADKSRARGRAGRNRNARRV